MYSNGLAGERNRERAKPAGTMFAMLGPARAFTDIGKLQAQGLITLSLVTFSLEQPFFAHFCGVTNIL